MPPNKSNQGNILANKRNDFRRSRFLVDLKKQAESVAPPLKKSAKLKSQFYDFLEQDSAKSKARFIKKESISLLNSFSLAGVIMATTKSLKAVGRALYGSVLAAPRLAAFILKPIQRVIKTTFNRPFLNQKQIEARPSLTPAENFAALHFSYKSVLLFTLVSLVLILPFKALTYYKSLDATKYRVMDQSRAGLEELFRGGQEASRFNFTAAERSFSSAGDNFLRARQELSGTSDLLLALASITPNKNLRLAANIKIIMAAGQTVAELAGNLNASLEILFQEKNNNLGEILSAYLESSQKARLNAAKLNLLLSQIKQSDLPAEYAGKFAVIKQNSLFLEKSLAEFNDLLQKLNLFLGENENKRYLFVFQNNTELRASGGFIGSYALLDFAQGRIKNIEVPGGGSYDTEAGLKLRIIAPEPLWLVNPLWHFWDANWWPDWPATAKKLAWFYEKSDGPTVDGVISITPTVMEDFLALTGPIDMTTDYGLTVDADNFWQVTQELAERKPEQTKKPKKIIGDLMIKILAELPTRLNQETLVGLIRLAEKNLNQKQILLFFFDPLLEDKLATYGWQGEIKNTAWDYLSVVNTNIAGGKSDRKIKQEINHQSEILPDGTIIDTLDIKRTHLGIKNEPFVGVRNVNWLRVYLPAGSELIEASGFSLPDKVYFSEPESDWQSDPDLRAESELALIDQPSGTKIYQEFGKTVFANWLMVDPGQSVTTHFKYKIPYKITERENRTFFEKAVKILNPGQVELYPYALLVQKQPGALNTVINSRLILSAADYKMNWGYPADLIFRNGQGWQIKENLDSDKYWAALLEKINNQ